MRLELVLRVNALVPQGKIRVQLREQLLFIVGAAIILIHYSKIILTLRI